MSDADVPQPHDRPFGSDVYRLICDHSGVALIAADIDLKVQVWNTAATRVFGVTAERMMGVSVLSVLPADRREAAERLLRRTLAEREVDEFEFDQPDMGGGRRYFAASVSPLVDCGDVTIGVLVWVRDVTRRMQLAQELALGRKMAALGEMAGAVAHHFNNILGGLVTSADFALAARDPNIDRRVLEQTSRSLARATRLVENLLAFAEGDRRTDALADLAEVLLHALDQIEPDLNRAGIKLELNLRQVPPAEVPRSRMTTAIFNFLHNAVEAMPDGGQLRVSLEHVEGNNVLRITDTGCGVAEDRLDRVFEPFYSTKGVAGGTGGQAAGLGLAVAHGIVREVGGRISFNSRVGAGTTVEICIPAGPPARDEQPQP